MAITIKELEALAMQLSIRERSELAHRLLLSIDNEPEGTPEEIAKAWDEEIARRVADLEAGRSREIPMDEVMASIRRIIDDAKDKDGQP
jgi:putative addiction module component (TIGR02574 family)